MPCGWSRPSRSPPTRGPKIARRRSPPATSATSRSRSIRASCCRRSRCSRARPTARCRRPPSGAFTLTKDHLAGGASWLAALLLRQILPVFSVVAPCHPGAALRDLVLVQRGRATSDPPSGGPSLCAIKHFVADPIHAHAIENLRYIRDAMSRAAAFTALPGWGGVAMGVTAIAAAVVSGPPDNSIRWVSVWLVEAAIAVAIARGTITIKARRAGTPLSTAAPAYRFALAYVPPLVAGMILTPVFATLDLMARLPGCWLLMYGTALASGGAQSIRVVPL